MSAIANPRELITRFANDNPNVQELQFIRDDPEGFEITDFSAHGMMNTILRARSGKGSIIIKYGETMARMDPSLEVSLDRQVIEVAAMELLQAVQPGSAPRAYCHDKTYNVIAMEDMSSWQLLGSQLQAGVVDLEAAASLGRLLANLHKSTSRKHVTTQHWEQLVEQFGNEEMKRETIWFLYERTYDETDRTNIIPQKALLAFTTDVAEIKKLGLDQKLASLFNVTECFIHSDCHWKSVFVKDGQSALLDFEYSFLGAAAQNVATPITGYLFCYDFQDETAEKDLPAKFKFRADCIQAVRNLLTAYADSHPDLKDDDARTVFFSDVALFLGSSLVLLGTYFAMDEFQYHTDKNRIFLFTRGFEVMKAHHSMCTIDQFISVLFKLQYTEK